jgi:hypothetical protein
MPRSGVELRRFFLTAKNLPASGFYELVYFGDEAAAFGQLSPWLDGAPLSHGLLCAIAAVS